MRVLHSEGMEENATDRQCAGHCGSLQLRHAPRMRANMICQGAVQMWQCRGARRTPTATTVLEWLQQ
jgi:hypothetical protein